MNLYLITIPIYILVVLSTILGYLIDKTFFDGKKTIYIVSTCIFIVSILIVLSFMNFALYKVYLDNSLSTILKLAIK